MKKIYEKFSKSFSKILFPILFKLFYLLRINRRAINFFSDKSFFLNNNQNFVDLINILLNKKRIIALDVGAQGGFNSDKFISSKYDKFFEPILIEPIKEEAEKIRKDQGSVIENGLWSSKIKKDIFIDYLKIDTQGAELEILKGIGNYRPLLIKVESHVHSMYKDVPSWNELLDYLYKLNYVVIDWKGIGSHATRVPAEMDMIFIPNFRSENGKKLILKNENEFISLMLIFGQISLLKIIAKKNNFKSFDKISNLQDFYLY